MLITVAVIYLIAVILSYCLIRRYMNKTGAVVNNLTLHLLAIASCAGIYMELNRWRHERKEKPVGDTALTMYKNGYNYVAGMLLYSGTNAESTLAKIRDVVEGKVDFANDAEKQYYEGMGDAYRDWVKHGKPSKRLIVMPGGHK